jgi:hypothetical protein
MVRSSEPPIIWAGKQIGSDAKGHQRRFGDVIATSAIAPTALRTLGAAACLKRAINNKVYRGEAQKCAFLDVGIKSPC